MFIRTVTAIYSVGHGLRTFTAITNGDGDVDLDGSSLPADSQ